MAKKITWDVIYRDFKKRHPTLRKQVLYWAPYDYLTIMLYLDDGQKMRYDYFNHQAKFVKEK